MFKKRMFAAGLLWLLVMSAVLLAGCGKIADDEGKNVSLAEMGTVILRVNPEIAVEYNKEGLVTKLSGLNTEGAEIVAGYTDYIGKNVRSVLKDLVSKINQAGYFVSAADGSVRNITIQIEPGSALPQENFMETLAGDVQSAVKTMELNTKIFEIGPDDYEDIPARQETSANGSAPQTTNIPPAETKKPVQSISKEKAMEIALLHAGFSASEVRFTEVERDYDDGRLEYEVEFVKDGCEYEYEIDGASGRILSVEKDCDDHDKKGNTAGKLITMDEAVAIALAHAGVKQSDAKFDDKELDYDDGRAIYELEFKANGMEYEYDVDASTGKILDFEWEKDDDHDKKGNTAGKLITMDEAVAIALAHAGVKQSDAKFDDKELDYDDGRAIYELEFEANGMEYEYDIDASTGKILDFEWEKDD